MFQLISAPAVEQPHLFLSAESYKMLPPFLSPVSGDPVGRGPVELFWFLSHLYCLKNTEVEFIFHMNI